MERKTGRLFHFVYQFCQWLTHFFYLNLLWIGFSLLGGIIFGIFPSTIALFSIARKHTRREVGFPIFKTFLKTYQKEFIQGNCLGWLFVLIGFILAIDLNFFRQMEGTFYAVMDVVTVITILIYGLILLYMFPVYVHFDLRISQYVKQAFLIAFLRPMNSFLLVFGTLGAYYFYITFPGFIPLFGLTILAYYQTWMVFRSFRTIERYAQKIQTNESHSARSLHLSKQRELSSY